MSLWDHEHSLSVRYVLSQWKMEKYDYCFKLNMENFYKSLCFGLQAILCERYFKKCFHFQVDNLGDKFVVLWRKGDRILSVGTLLVRKDGKVNIYLFDDN